MIKNLVIDNIALIEHVDIDFREGLTVLTGETGSGKSIIIDSLAFVLGDRADKTLIKTISVFSTMRIRIGAGLVLLRCR